jgi:hypothetical protein
MASAPAVAGTDLSPAASGTKADDKVDIAECRREYKRGVKFCSDEFAYDTVEYESCIEVERDRFRACMLGNLQTAVSATATTVAAVSDSVDWVEVVVVEVDGSETVLAGGMPAADGAVSLRHGAGNELPAGTTVRVEQWSGDELVSTELVRVTK